MTDVENLLKDKTSRTFSCVRVFLDQSSSRDFHCKRRVLGLNTDSREEKVLKNTNKLLLTLRENVCTFLFLLLYVQ